MVRTHRHYGRNIDVCLILSEPYGHFLLPMQNHRNLFDTCCTYNVYSLNYLHNMRCISFGATRDKFCAQETNDQVREETRPTLASVTAHFWCVVISSQPHTSERTYAAHPWDGTTMRYHYPSGKYASFLPCIHGVVDSAQGQKLLLWTWCNRS